MSTLSLKRFTVALLASGLLVTPGVARPKKDVQAEITSAPFAKFLTYRTYRVSEGGELWTGGFVFGPGHHISSMAALVFDAQGRPCATFKTGDTRLSRQQRGAPYVATSGIAGRWDKKGHSAGAIVLDELSEEVGGQVVEGTFRRLGQALSPTMPFESTECDEYFMAAVDIVSDPQGDGGSMEVPGLIGPVFYSPQDAIKAMDSGAISDSARARAMFGRAWDSLGYIPSLDMYALDNPGLLSSFDSLGMGPLTDLRGRVEGETSLPAPRVRDGSESSRIDSAEVVSSEEVALESGRAMVDARIRHAIRGQGPVGGDFASQYLKLGYDRAKVALYYIDPDLGPMVEMAPQVRPALAFAPGSPLVKRRDLRDVPVPRTLDAMITAGVVEKMFGRLGSLAPGNAASSGQSDLFYHYFACQVQPPRVSPSTPTSGNSNPGASSDYLPLSQAILLTREGHGDAQTEATLLRLADRLEWIPQLGMSREQALELANTPLVK